MNAVEPKAEETAVAVVKSESVEVTVHTVSEETAAPEPDTISKVHSLQKRFYAVCGELFKYIEFIGEPMYNLMLEHYFTQYKREYELMNAAEFIEVDKKIEELKAERDRELEAVKLERDKQKRLLDITREKAIQAIELDKAKLAEELTMIRDRELEAVKLERDKQKRLLDITREKAIRAIELDKAKLAEELTMIREKELEEVRLEHDAQTAEISRKREKLNKDIEVLWETTLVEAQIKISRITPDSWRKYHIGKLHFGKVCSNEAMQYAEKAANNEITEYLTARARAVNEVCDEEEVAEPAPMTEREYKKWQKRFEKEQRKRKGEAEKQSEPEEQEARQEPAAAEVAETQEQGGEPDTAADVALIAENVEGG